MNTACRAAEFEVLLTLLGHPEVTEVQHPPLPRSHTAMRNVWDFGREMELTGPLRDARRFPSTRWYPVPTCTHTPRNFGICPSFTDHSLSPPRAKR